MTTGTKIALTFIAFLVSVTLWGSLSLRHAFVEIHTHTTTTNSIIDSFGN